MNDLRVLCMQIVESVAKLIRPHQNFLLRKRTLPLCQHPRQIVTRDVLHHQKLAVTLVEMIADTRQRLVVHPRQQTRLSLELLAQLFVGEKGFFQRHSGVETLIHSLVHGSHATLTELPNNPIAALQNCVCCQHKFSCLLRSTSLSFCAIQGQQH